MAVPPAEHPYASFVHLVQKPARYLGGEFGAKKKDFESVEARVCLAFPDVYDIGMSHLGFKILYKLLNDDSRTLAERAYAPWIDMEAQLRARKLPLVSCESARPLCDFDVVGFSLQFELTYTNVLLMLDLGGIPLRADARSEDDPLVLAGGPTATHPEPLAPFPDAIVVGDGEERTSEVALTWTKLKRAGIPREERLRSLAALPGLYVPSLYTTHLDAETGFEVVNRPARATAGDPPFPVVRTIVDDLNRFPFPDDSPIGGPEAIFDRMSIEIARGCTEGCRFCQAGMIYRPVRERDPQQIVDTVVRAVEKERLRRGKPHIALDRRLFVHRTPRKKGRGCSGAEESIARSFQFARVRLRGERSRRHRARSRHQDYVRPRSGHATYARRHQQERHRRTASGDCGACVLAWLGEHEALLHDWASDRRGGGRSRHSAGRSEGARRRQTGQTRARSAWHAQSDGQRVDTRSQAAHPVSVVRHGRDRGREKEARLAARGSARGKRRSADARLRDVVARGRLRAGRSLARTGTGGRLQGRGSL